MLAFSLRFNTREKDGLEILVQRLESRLWGVGGGVCEPSSQVQGWRETLQAAQGPPACPPASSPVPPSSV